MRTKGEIYMGSEYADSAAVAAAGSALVIVYVIAIVFCIIAFVAMWKLFSKAGEAGWKCLIPIYNSYILFKIVYGNGLKFLLLLVPVLNVVIGIVFYFRLAQVYGKGAGFGFLTLLFPEICLPVLAFGKSEYQGPIDSFI